MTNHPLDDLCPRPGRSLGVANYGAASQVIALERGERWRCGRVDAWVDQEECIARYLVAKNADGYCPCRECATVARLLKKKGGNMARTATRAAAKPAAKKAPAPVREETPPDIFEAWDKYTPVIGTSISLPAARLTRNEMILNLSAYTRFGLSEFLSADIFHRPGRIGLRLHPDQAGTLRLTSSRNKTTGRNTTFSSPGMVRAFGLQEHMGKRYLVRQLAPDALEIDLTEEV